MSYKLKILRYWRYYQYFLYFCFCITVFSSQNEQFHCNHYFDPTQYPHLEKPTSMYERLLYYTEKIYVLLSDHSSKSAPKQDADNKGDSKHRLSTNLSDSKNHLNPINDDQQAQNIGLNQSHAQNSETQDPVIVAELNQPYVKYFRRTVAQNIHFRSGQYISLPILNSQQTDLPLGVPDATMRLTNLQPGIALDLFVPNGFAVIKQSNQNQIDIWRDKRDRYFFKSLIPGKHIVHLSKDKPTPLTTLELSAYTTVHSPVLLDEWPDAFGILLRDFVKFTNKNRKKFSDHEIAEVTKSLIQYYFKYTNEEQLNTSVIDIVRSKKLQCTWAAVLEAGILRQYFGIPARVVTGDVGKTFELLPDSSYVIASTVIHAWAEYYDYKDQKWHIADATPHSHSDTLSTDKNFWDTRLANLNSSVDTVNYNLDTLESFKENKPEIIKLHSLLSIQKDTELINQKFPGLRAPFTPNWNLKELMYSIKTDDPLIQEQSIKTAAYVYLETLWQITIESWNTLYRSTNYNDPIDAKIFKFPDSLYKFIKHIEEKRSNLFKTNPNKYLAVAAIFSAYEVRAIELFAKICIWKINLNPEDQADQNTSTVVKHLLSDDQTERFNAAEFYYVIMTELNRYRSLNEREQIILNISKKILLNVQIENNPDQKIINIYHDLCKRGRILAIDQQLNRKYSKNGNIDYKQFWVDLQSGQLNDILMILQQGTFFKYNIFSELSSKMLDPILISTQVPISDEEPHFETAVSLENYRKFVNKGYGFNHDILKFLTGRMEEKTYYDQEARTIKEHQPQLVAIVLVTDDDVSFKSNFQIILNLLSAAVLSDENIVFIASNGYRKVKIFRDFNEILNYDQLMLVSTQSDYQSAIENLNPDRLIIVNLPSTGINGKNTLPSLILHGAYHSNARSEQWNFCFFDEAISYGRKSLNTLRTQYKCPMLNSSFKLLFKEEIEKIKSVKSLDKISLTQHELDALNNPNFDLQYTEQLQTSDVKKISELKEVLQIRAKSIQNFHNNIVLTNIFKEVVEHRKSLLGLTINGMSSFEHLMIIRFIELVTSQYPSEFAKTMGPDLLRIFYYIIYGSSLENTQ